jgi:hypothetical protein
MRMDKLSTTIKRQRLQEIVARRKKIEYHAIKPYSTKRLKQIQTPFLLRLINGMQYKAPEVTVHIDKVRKNTRHGDYELHIQRIIAVRNWDRRRERSTSKTRDRGK